MSDFRDNNFQHIDDEEINVLDEDFTEKFGSRNKTTESANNDFGKFENNSNNTSQQQGESAQQQSANSGKPNEGFLSAHDYEDVAEFVIDIIDGGISKGLAFIAKEDLSKSSKFEIKAEKKFKLRKQLSRIFEKHQVKISIEIIFFITLCLAYAPVTKDAFRLRKENEEKENSKSEKEKAKTDKKPENKKEPEPEPKSKYEKITVITDAEIVEEMNKKHSEDEINFVPEKGTGKKKKGKKEKEEKIITVEESIFETEGIDRENM